MLRSLGTCYYPEHWAPDVWREDADRMVAAGLTWVRIGEFAWSRMEPRHGVFDWDWLDSAIDILGTAGLKVVLGTPTATPPRWMLDRLPDMLAVDKDGRERRFGSRRHYCFSHLGYRAECVRIAEALAQRYGNNQHIAAWQIDNEYGCHDTTLSYSPSAREAFQAWLESEYATIDRLNEVWGNTFWSMTYQSFAQVDLPNLTVTEPNPAHSFDFRRFSSDQVVKFNRAQVDAIRAHSDAPVAHNYMGRITDFDHFAVGADLDIASWDSYPLGFLQDRVGASDADTANYLRQGDPDFQAFHHDLYRAVGNGRWWIMEQQPGPVNWAAYNPAPLPGMVRLWTWEAFAHGAETVCYFRWRQAPFAQEQLHTGLLRPDSTDAGALAEVREVARELGNGSVVEPVTGDVAILFDYEADFAWSVQPHRSGLDYFGIVFEAYKALRRMGLSVDILPAKPQEFGDHSVVLAPGLIFMTDELKQSLADNASEVVIGPRSAAKVAGMQTPAVLPPDFPGLDLRVAFAESLPDWAPLPLSSGGQFRGYREKIEGAADVVATLRDGSPAVTRSGRTTYVAGAVDTFGWQRILAPILERSGVGTDDLPDGLRTRRTATERFWFNYGAEEVSHKGRKLPPAGVLREPI